ncbi:hypothetical protein B0H17DRAFT_224219 [Mycena rosella]|uniref:Uncharacterized protein n=1 Tax=Mycena rosella TaxID=1033263 RepID=A0AAD7G5F4_MYCRO|nr:hypothetical protein B0H17DRAFT_224219 [Mycena rosella]
MRRRRSVRLKCTLPGARTHSKALTTIATHFRRPASIPDAHPVPSSLVPAPSQTPSGCTTADFRPNLSGSIIVSPTFSGCVVTNPAVLQACCTRLGSTAAFVNVTCGCPYNASVGFASGAPFVACVRAASTNAWAGCTARGATGAAGRRLRLHSAVVVFGAALVAAAVGV